MSKVDLSKYEDNFGLQIKLKRLLWLICYYIFFRPFPTKLFGRWHVTLLRFWGAKIGNNSTVFNNVKIWAPWNLEMKNNCMLGPYVDCYNQGKISIGSHTVVSQKTYLCASSHDFAISNLPLTLNPINIGNQVWIAADSFIGPDVTVGDGAVIGARAAVFKNVEPWTVIGGNPAKFIKKREMKN
ncbi:putative colanic acid biosynthesis acetyltransferase [uncultured Chryseobacterium sp.]|uniref:putative colanic acid biosynthesis acetyltransferase n=1 Tax=uncultured Chryseobacterium sp. TaxID=259322 RepID=UPI0026047C0B|nr:putative colanic acid biosynthesis acetyltransferase [uncultured Chryseobacterium sp.]